MSQVSWLDDSGRFSLLSTGHPGWDSLLGEKVAECCYDELLEEQDTHALCRTIVALRMAPTGFVDGFAERLGDILLGNR